VLLSNGHAQMQRMINNC